MWDGCEIALSWAITIWGAGSRRRGARFFDCALRLTTSNVGGHPTGIY
jgi:hypothetical protein